MPTGGIDGFACVRRARELLPALKVIVLSAFDEEQCVDRALSAGANAYIVKTARPDDIASAIRQAFEQSIHYAGERNGIAAPTAKRPNGDALHLTRRELEILRLVAQGHTNAELARMLWVTEQTVKFHLSNTYRKLNVSNRTEASRWAQLHGLLSTDGRADMGPENHRAGVTAFPRRSKANRPGTDGRDVEYPLEARGVAQPG